MPIIRGKHHFDGHFTQIPNAWLRDVRLSYKARGLLAELLSHAPGFEVSRERLARSGQDGDRAIRTAIAELESAGYLKRSQTRSEGSRFGAAVWVTCDPFDVPEFVVDSEQSGLAVADIGPSVRFAPAGFAPADNATPKNTESKNTESKNNLVTKPKAQVELEQAFDEFWSVYPRKQVKVNAKRAFERLWRKYGRDIIDGAKRLAADPNLPPVEFIPHPATWLNRLGWEEPPYPPREKTKAEKEAEERRLYEERRARDLERRERQREEARLERERIERERRENPVPFCEHGRIVFNCKICGPAALAEAEAKHQDADAQDN